MPLFAGEKYLHRAARTCMRRCSAAGADRVTWAQYRRGLAERIHVLSGRLFAGTWAPGPVRHVEVTSYTGKTFVIVVPTVEDRIVHRALRTAVEPILEASAFASWVSGYRPNRSRITAVRAAARHVTAGRGCVADIDVAQVSAGATTEEVVGWLARHIHDGTLLDRFLTMLAGLPAPLAPGSGLAPLLINLRLSRVDGRLGGLPVVRFADNYCAFAPSIPAAEAAFAVIVDALAAEGLRAHPTKSRTRVAANPEDLFLIAG